MANDDYKRIRNDAARAAESLRGCSVRFSPFSDEWGASVYISELKAVGNVKWTDSGGLPGASNRIVAFSCGELPGIDAIPFIYLYIKPLSGLTRAPVPDVLNALSNAGLSKDNDVGDVYGHENGHYVIAVDRRGIFPPSVSEIEVDGFLISRIEKSDFDKVAVQPSSKGATVASQRLDAVVSLTANISRSKAKKMIEAGLVMVDYVTVIKAEKPIDVGSTISMKGKRRSRIVSIDGPTKKGRFRVSFEPLP